MSITDELREWAEEFWVTYSIFGDQSNLIAIADRIDAEHERLCSRSRSNGYSDGFNDGFNDIESWVIDHEDAMAEHGWIRLPKDADGVPIHVGDVMEWCDSGDTLEVIGIGDDTLFYVDPEGDRTYAEWTSARNKRHHHAPTVEDVLTEFGIDWEHESDCEDRAALLKEYASKLRLAEGEDA